MGTISPYFLAKLAAVSACRIESAEPAALDDEIMHDLAVLLPYARPWLSRLSSCQQD
jgi:hypothetical protein